MKFNKMRTESEKLLGSYRFCLKMHDIIYAYFNYLGPLYFKTIQANNRNCAQSSSRRPELLESKTHAQISMSVAANILF
jgi:hypothetical protein